MYAVIFTAQLKNIDKTYSETSKKMQDLAISKYGCTEFISVTEAGQEIAISYWQNQAQIKAWKQDVEHLAAQKLGRSTWYKYYKVQIVEIIREYSS